MFDPDEVVNGISAYVNLLVKNNSHPLHIYYISDEEIGLSEDELKKSFMFFVNNNFPSVKHISIDEIKTDFEHLSTNDKAKYFSSKFNIIDCTDINQENVSAYHSLNELSEDTGVLLFYYVTKKKKVEFIVQSRQFKSAGVYYDLDKEIYSFYQYNKLKEELNMNQALKQEPKKNKI